jgi:hypothetical protein
LFTIQSADRNPDPPKEAKMLELAKVTRVLRDEWDPFYLNEIPEAAQEYDAYAPALLGLVLNGADEAAIVAHLLTVETESMGLDGDPARAARVAKLALASVSAAH